MLGALRISMRAALACLLILVTVSAAQSRADAAKCKLAMGTHRKILRASDQTRHDVDSLISAGRLQEALWFALDSGKIADILRTRNTLEKSLASAKVVATVNIDMKLYGERVFDRDDIDWVLLEDGTEAIFRRDRLKDFVVYELIDLLGSSTLPVAIERTIDGHKGSLQAYVPRSHHEVALEEQASDEARAQLPHHLAAKERPDFDEPRFFQALLNDADVSGQNSMISPTGRHFLIDPDAFFSFHRTGRQIWGAFEGDEVHDFSFVRLFRDGKLSTSLKETIRTLGESQLKKHSVLAKHLTPTQLEVIWRKILVTRKAETVASRTRDQIVTDAQFILEPLGLTVAGAIRKTRPNYEAPPGAHPEGLQLPKR